MNDTVFGLEALIGFGFGLPGFQPDPRPESDFSQYRLIKARVTFIEQTVHWLESNRVGPAWHFVSAGGLTHSQAVSAKVGPTANAVSALSRLAKQLEPVKPWTRGAAIRRLVGEAAEWLARCQLSDGGFGRDAADTGRLAHTIAAGSALLDADPVRFQNQIIRAFGWVIRNGKSHLQKAAALEFFDEYSQTVMVENRSLSKRIIHHEYAVEARGLSFLADVFTARQSLKLSWMAALRLWIGSESMAQHLFARQVKEGRFRGAFLSRRDFYGERYPIYWLYYGCIGATDYARITKDRFINKFTKELVIQAVLVTILVGAFAYFTKASAGSLIGAIAVGVAANLVTPAIRKAK